MKGVVTGILGAAIVGLLMTLALISSAHAGEFGRVTDLLTQPLANVPGKEVTMITVEYAPGGSDPVHRHDASAFIYVLEGTIEMQMEGGEKVTLRPGPLPRAWTCDARRAGRMSV